MPRSLHGGAVPRARENGPIRARRIVARELDSRGRHADDLGMPIADDPRAAPRYRVTVRHPIGGALKYNLDSLDPGDPAAVATIAGDLKQRGYHWPPPREFAEASLRRLRGAAAGRRGRAGARPTNTSAARRSERPQSATTERCRRSAVPLTEHARANALDDSVHRV